MSPLWFGKKNQSEVEQIRRHLDESFDKEEGTDRKLVPGRDEDKLRGLVLCVRRRYRSKTGGHTREAIARRAQITLDSVHQIIGGEFAVVRWDAVESVLKALNASPAEITVAVELHDKIRKTRAKRIFGPRRRRPGESTLVPLWPPAPSIPDVPWPSHPLYEPVVTTNTDTVLMDDDVPEPTGGALELTKFLKELSTMDISTAVVNDVPESLGESELPKLPQETPKAGTEDSGRTYDVPELPEDEALDPMKAETVDQFVTAMKVFRVAMGEKPYREMSDTSWKLKEKFGLKGYSSATFNTIGNNGKLPKRDVVRSYIAAAGGETEDIDRWDKARTHLATKLQAKVP